MCHQSKNLVHRLFLKLNSEENSNLSALKLLLMLGSNAQETWARALPKASHSMFCSHATRGVQAELGEEDQHPQRCDARRAFSPH